MLDSLDMNLRERTGIYAIDESLTKRRSQTQYEGDSETKDANRRDSPTKDVRVSATRLLDQANEL